MLRSDRRESECLNLHGHGGVTTPTTGPPASRRQHPSSRRLALRVPERRERGISRTTARPLGCASFWAHLLRSRPTGVPAHLGRYGAYRCGPCSSDGGSGWTGAAGHGATAARPLARLGHSFSAGAAHRMRTYYRVRLARHPWMTLTALVALTILCLSNLALVEDAAKAHPVAAVLRVCVTALGLVACGWWSLEFRRGRRGE